MGHPASPFMDEVEEQVTERKGDKSQVEEGFQYHRAFLLLYAGPADTVDGNWDGSTPVACSPLMPLPGVISGSWRPIPSRRGDVANQRAGQRPYRE